MKNIRLPKSMAVVLLAPIFLLVCSCFVRADDSADAFAKAKQFTYVEKWPAAVDTFKGFVKNYPSSDLLDDAVFWLGFSLIKTGSNDCAIMVLNTFFSDWPDLHLDSDIKLHCNDITFNEDELSRPVLSVSGKKMLKGFDCKSVHASYKENAKDGSIVEENRMDLKLDCASFVTERKKTYDKSVLTGATITIDAKDCDEFTYIYKDRDWVLKGNGFGFMNNGCEAKKDTVNGDSSYADSAGVCWGDCCSDHLSFNCSRFGTSTNTDVFSLSKYTDDALYYKGIAYMNKKDFKAGIEVFRGLVKKFDDSMWAPEALYRAIDYYAGIGDYASALPAYEAFLKKFKSDMRIFDMKAGYCTALGKSGRHEDCVDYLEHLKKKKDPFANSVTAEIVRIYRDNENAGPAQQPAPSSLLCGKSYRVTSAFGPRESAARGSSNNHAGVDMVPADSTLSGKFFDVCAPADGDVIFAGWKGGYGLTVIIHHNNEYSTLYGHAQSILVKPGQRVRRGEKIMNAGSSGISTGTHLHYALFRYGIPVDPLLEGNFQDAVKRGDLERMKDFIAAGADVNSADKKGKTPLHYAAGLCDWKDTVELLLSSGADTERVDSRGDTPLFDAIMHNCTDTVKLFIKRGVDVNKKYNYGRTPLFAAWEWNAFGAASLLIDAGADVNAKNDMGYTLLHNSMSPESREFAALLLEHGADVNAKAPDGRTPIYSVATSFPFSRGKDDTIVKLFLAHEAKIDVFTAALLGDADAIKKYLDQGGDPNARFGDYGPLLNHAAIAGNAKIIEMLIGRGAKVNDKSDSGSNPLGNAVMSRNKDAVLALLNHGADVSMPSWGGRTPLYVAASPVIPKGEINPEIVDALISHGAKMDIYGAVCLDKRDFVEDYINTGKDVNATGPNGFTPLLAAIDCDKKEMVKLLLEKGANPNLQADGGNESKYMYYPLHKAASHAQTDIAALLLEHGADVNARNSQQMTPLHWAVIDGDVEAAELLISHGADVNAKMDGGKTPLDMTNIPDMENLLIEHGAQE